MTDDQAVEKIVTNFFCYTCRPTSQPQKHAVCAAMWAAKLAIPNPKMDGYVKANPLITGSAAEFLMTPILPHLGDIDVMYHLGFSLAVPQGHPPPTQLPDEFHDHIDVYEIIDTHLPGYVYLEARYLLTKCTDSERYNVKERKEKALAQVIYRVNNPQMQERHGPAYCQYPMRYGDISTDLVLCFRCFSWPPQAADWPTRHRYYEWPDSATVDRVVSNGCDVVQVAHRQCREDECMCRLSFSRAEITLINSWTDDQQIVYHALRVFMKIDRLTQSVNDSETGAISNYHIKTLMLWACELKPKSWWTDFNLIRICVDLLHTLAGWLSKRRCPHYFINNCNLIDESLPLDTLASRLRSIKRDWLLEWFVNNYIRKSAQVCPGSVSRLLDDVSSSRKLEYAVLKIAQWRSKTWPAGKWLAANSDEYFIAENVSRWSEFDPHCVSILTNELIKIHPRYTFYTTVLAFLHLANRITRLSGPMDESLMHAVSVAANDYRVLSECYEDKVTLRHNIDMVGRNCQQIARSLADGNKAELVELMQQSAVGFMTTFLQIEEQDFGSVATIATTMFEALYAYKQGDYQQCLQLSTENVGVLRNAEHMTYVPTFPEFIQLMDDDIVSLSALTLIVNARCREERSYNATVTQLTLSLYLMTQCQLKLRHTGPSLAQTLYYIEEAKRMHDVCHTLDHLTLKFIEHKLVAYITGTTC